jgi:hypothetical protein
VQPITYRGDQVPRWRTYEVHLLSPRQFDEPSQDATLAATFVAPSGCSVSISGFWDGGDDWRVRFAPTEEGAWHYQLQLNDGQGAQVANATGDFTCTAALDETVFDQHGPVRLADHKRHLEHVDGTPFFWLADTAWNGPLLSTAAEWDQYLETRVRQRFSAVQWVATQWRAAPDGDIEGQLAFDGSERIAINPTFFQRLDTYVERNAAAGLLNVPVMLWAIGAGANPTIDPGFGLPEDQAIVVARYMVARWGAYPLAWILSGDAKYVGDYAERWRRIGRAVFGDQEHVPVAVHCGGTHWPAEEFREEPWLDILGYQSGHGDSDSNLEWIVKGPPAQEWDKTPRLFQLNLEPAYENHIAYHSKQPLSPHTVRMATYWSLLNAPTAGVSYGGHGVWGWDDGTVPSKDHPGSGIPLPWQQALTMPAAEQTAYLAKFFMTIPWWTLSPAPELLKEQPGEQDVHRYVLVSASDRGDLVVAYMPMGGTIRLDATQVKEELTGSWCNPRTGARQAAIALDPSGVATFTAPDNEDWLLILQNSSGD